MLPNREFVEAGGSDLLLSGVIKKRPQPEGCSTQGYQRDESHKLNGGEAQLKQFMKYG